MDTPQFDMFHDLKAPEVQTALGIDPASDAKWMDMQSDEIEAMLIAFEWDELREIADTERRMQMALEAAD